MPHFRLVLCLQASVVVEPTWCALTFHVWVARPCQRPNVWNWQQWSEPKENRRNWQLIWVSQNKMGMPLKSAVPKIANDDAPQKLLDHLQGLNLFQGTRWIGGSLTPQWRFKSDQLWPKEKKKHGQKLWQTQISKQCPETKIPPGFGRFHRCKNKIKTGRWDFWIKTLSPIFVALLLCSWPLLWATIRRSLAEVSLSKLPNGWISFYVDTNNMNKYNVYV